MEMESPSFTEQDLRAFIDEVVAYEEHRQLDGLTVVERLGAGIDRLGALVALMGPGRAGQPASPATAGPGPDRGSAKAWNAREILAHIVLVSQVLGWGMWAVGTGEQDEISLMSFLNLRDISGSTFAGMAARELLAIARHEITTAIEYLCLASPEEMGRVGRVGPFELTAEHIGQFLLCAHMELHIDQLERALTGAAAPSWQQEN